MSETGLGEWFDGPIVEPVKIRQPDPSDPTKSIVETVDVSFIRADMDYWDVWALNLKTKRRRESLDELNKIPNLSGSQRADAVAVIMAKEIQIFEVLDQRFTTGGIKKILNDALLRGGMTDGNRRKLVIGSIYPGRQFKIAEEICSEPKPTITQIREAAKSLAAKLGKLPGEIADWNDEKLIEFLQNYTPPEDPENPTDAPDKSGASQSTGEPATQ